MGSFNCRQGVTLIVVAQFDIFPTFLELAGAKAPTFLELAGAKAPAGIDAVSLGPILRGEPLETPERELYFVRREGNPKYLGKAYHALIRGDWKILQNHPFEPYELYNLKDDPQEQNNLAKARPEIFNKLSLSLASQIQRGGTTPWQAPKK